MPLRACRKELAALTPAACPPAATPGSGGAPAGAGIGTGSSTNVGAALADATPNPSVASVMAPAHTSGNRTRGLAKRFTDNVYSSARLRLVTRATATASSVRNTGVTVLCNCHSRNTTRSRIELSTSAYMYWESLIQRSGRTPGRRQACVALNAGPGLWFHESKDFRGSGIVDWVMNEVKMAEDVRAEIVASVLEVVVREGAQIDEGDTVVLLESMKMEIPVLAETAGTVSKVAVKVGDVIQAGDLIAVIS